VSASRPLTVAAPERPVSWRAALEAAVRDEFRGTPLVPPPGSSLLPAACAVPGCVRTGFTAPWGRFQARLCHGHADRWIADGRPADSAGWVAAQTALLVISVVRNQLAPQKIFFPKPAEYASLKPYAGQQVVNGTQAKLYANDQLGPDLNKVAGGKTYSQVSAEWIAGGMKSATLASQRTTLFTGETLKGLLLNAWGWAQIGSIAILAGILLIVFGGILFTLPVLNWLLNLRPELETTKSQRIPQALPDAATS
jgi:hypothetical protein